MYDENASSQLMAIASLIHGKDSRWLQLEVCREFQRGQCSRSDQECKFSHPPPHVEIQNGRVTACFDSIKGRCTRENPKCKYLHPPQHLKDQLCINGRNNLALKNLLFNQLTSQATVTAAPISVNPLATMTYTGAMIPGVQAATYSPYAAYALNPTASAVYPGLVASPDILNSVGTLLQTNGTSSTSPAIMAAALALQAQRSASVNTTAQNNRFDRIEVCREFARGGTCSLGVDECPKAHPPPHVSPATGDPPAVTVCMDFALRGGEAGCARHPCRYFHPPKHLMTDAASAKVPESAAVATTLANVGSSAAVTAAAVQNQQQLLAAAYVAAFQAATAAAAARGNASASSLTTPVAVGLQQASANGATVSKKRPLEAADNQAALATAAAYTADPYLMAAAAALNSSMAKRTALDKSGMPFYQPLTAATATTGFPAGTVSLGIQYPQYAAIPTLQASPYLPYLTFAGQPPGLPRL